MKQKTQKILTWVIVGATILVIGGFVVSQVFSRKRAKSKFKRKIIDIANKEWEDWNKGKTSEKSSSMYGRLKQYWDSIGWDESRWTPSGVAWSSAFISWVMAKSGGLFGIPFKKASAHATYIREYVKNRKEGKLNAPFVAYRINEKPAEVGDLVCYSREGSSDMYDRTSNYKSHCDIVVATNRKKNEIEVIGGNVAQSVAKRVLSTDPQGKVNDPYSKWFAIIKNNA